LIILNDLLCSLLLQAYSNSSDQESSCEASCDHCLVALVGGLSLGESTQNFLVELSVVLNRDHLFRLSHVLSRGQAYSLVLLIEDNVVLLQDVEAKDDHVVVHDEHLEDNKAFLDDDLLAQVDLVVDAIDCDVDRIKPAQDFRLGHATWLLAVEDL
jgi:hypothetical protein